MRRLGALEAVVMQHLWETEDSVSVREVLVVLGRDREIAYTTVMTVLDNLYGKGFVSRLKDGRAYRYSPRMTREEHTAGLLDEVLGETPDRGAALMHFVGRLSDEDVAELRTALSSVDDEEVGP